MTEHYRFEAPLGGVLAEQVGALSGCLLLRRTLTEGKAEVEVAYDLTDEWWPVAGSPVSPEFSLQELAAVLARDPGSDEYENPRCSDLSSLTPRDPARE